VSDTELSRMTTLMSNDSGILVVKMRPNSKPDRIQDELVLMLDGINDP
jgi:tRNA G18 (ribose-2'-O)-methylase SpoU